MLVPMAKIHIIGHRSRLDDTLGALHDLRCVQLTDSTEDPGLQLPPMAMDEGHLHEIEELRYLRTRIDALLSLVSVQAPEPGVSFDEADLGELRAELAELGPEIENLAGRLDQLESERQALPRHLESLRRLLPLLPDVGELRGYQTEALLIDQRHVGVLGALHEELGDLVGDNFEIISAPVDPETVGAILVFPHTHAEQVAGLLGKEAVTRVRLPGGFEGMPFRQAIAAMQKRIGELPREIASATEALSALVRPKSGWHAARRFLTSRIEQLEAIRQLGATHHTFAMSGWVPQRDRHEVAEVLEAEVGGGVVLEEVEPEEGEGPPALLDNRRPVRPFEFLVALISLPRYGSIDPTALMALFMPLFFGMMLGDVVYGTTLMVISLWVRARFGGRHPLVAMLSRIFVLAAAWSIVWGFVYGEYLGDLGRRLIDLQPLWINREEAIQSFLVFAIAVGAAHIVLGLLLGVWQAYRFGERKLAGSRIGMLVSLAGLFLLVGAAADRLPSGFITPSIAAMVVGIAVLIGIEGPLGALLGPMEFLSTVGNVLSYLRIAAIGIASVYLARVANELGTTGPLWIGIIVAALFHALNLTLGTFSPAIQALRLQYVEFFGKFYEEGGVAFRPFGESGQEVANVTNPS